MLIMAVNAEGRILNAAFHRLLNEARELLEDVRDAVDRIRTILARVARRPNMDLLHLQRASDEVHLYQGIITDLVERPLVQNYGEYTVTIVISRNANFPQNLNLENRQ